jgi:hypothetical protein
VVQVDDEGRIVARMWGPVPAPLPQTPQVAEYLAYTAALEVLSGPSVLYDDCLNLVRAVQNKTPARFKWNRPNAGILRAAYAAPGAKCMEAMHKVAAHQDSTILVDPHDIWLASCNGHADTYAKVGASSHAMPPEPVRQDLDRSMAEVKVILMVIARVCGLWPKAKPPGGRLTLRPRSKPPVTILYPYPAGPRHAWEHWLGGWRCNSCLRWASADPRGGPRSWELCCAPPLASIITPTSAIA